MDSELTHERMPLLFLCHRIPYPPNKGDKIRSFHLLHHLSQEFDVHLATFVDDPNDIPHIPSVEKLCKSSLHLQLKPWQAKIRSLCGLLTGDALSVPYYSSAEMQRWVDQVVSNNNIEHVIVYSSSMAQFVPSAKFQFKRQVIDFVDIDSDKWRQYAKQKKWPMSWLYQREANCLLTLEKDLAKQFDAGLFVSSSEAEMFKQLSPESASKIGYYNNGVNTQYFDPNLVHENPYPAGTQVIVFTGAMDYWPNEDAVVWFSKQVLPGLLKEAPQLKFYIVGGNPGKKVRQLGLLPGVVVTGRVKDIRPWIHHSLAAVAPMRVARGIQNKVLEAMAMEKPVLVSSKGLEGIDAIDGEHMVLADNPPDYVRYIHQVLTGEMAGMGASARTLVKEKFNWDENLPEVVLLLASQPGQLNSGGQALNHE